MGGLRGKEKWSPEKIGFPKAREIRRGRREGPSGKSGRGAEGNCPPLGSGKPAEIPGLSPALQSTPPQAVWVLGGIGGRPGRAGEAGRTSHLGGAGEEQRAFALPTQARGAC